MKKIKESKAITLVALVITIIILLILAGISIAQLTGNGLFEKAKIAKDVSKNAQEDENRKINEYGNEINEHINSDRGTVTISEEEYNRLLNASNANNFSTTEHVVGTWIDGKPIYQITINCGALPNTRDKEIAHNVSNIDYVINAFGIGINSNNGYSIIIGGTGTNSNHASDVGLYASRSIIKVRAYDDRSAYTGYVTIQYTKTTD